VTSSDVWGEPLAGWDGSPFTADSESHISVWRKPGTDADRGGGHGEPSPAGGGPA